MVDSLQYLTGGKPTEVLETLCRWAHAQNRIVWVIGHTTKTGSFAGRNTIAHQVDVRLEVRVERNGARTLVVAKNRLGGAGQGEIPLPEWSTGGTAPSISTGRPTLRRRAWRVTRWVWVALLGIVWVLVVTTQRIWAMFR